MFGHRWCSEALAFTHRSPGHFLWALVVILIPAQAELAKKIRKFDENRNVLNCNKGV